MTEDIHDTLKQRGTRYGTLMENGAISQAFKQIARGGMEVGGTMEVAPNTSWNRMEPDQRQALDVIFDKISRILAGDPDYDDNWRDIIGYAQLVLNRLNEEKASTPWNP